MCYQCQPQRCTIFCVILKHSNQCSWRSVLGKALRCVWQRAVAKREKISCRVALRLVEVVTHNVRVRVESIELLEQEQAIEAEIDVALAQQLGNRSIVDHWRSVRNNCAPQQRSSIGRINERGRQ